ncbi:MAG: hypothetical protein DCE90_03930 [Pseudanabaena sp.]|nr:MAG: hypothetical protein DCE90_03930 [Pseudanabaena sp.]
MANAIISKFAIALTAFGALVATVFTAPSAIDNQIQAHISPDYPQIVARSPISTSVKINEKHIFEGEINRRGLAVGYHHRANSRDARNARLVRVVSNPNSQGVYVGRVEIRNSKGQWINKSANSSFFPDRWSRNQVLSEIRGAFANSPNPLLEPWQGTSPSGLRISGYYNRNTNTINTAYPIYRR